MFLEWKLMDLFYTTATSGSVERYMELSIATSLKYEYVTIARVNPKPVHCLSCSNIVFIKACVVGLTNKSDN